MSHVDIHPVDLNYSLNNKVCAMTNRFTRRSQNAHFVAAAFNCLILALTLEEPKQLKFQRNYLQRFMHTQKCVTCLVD